jgi:type II secretory pathway pseudopilin PulG
MNTQTTHTKATKKRLGFTLVETAIAMGMVAVMISSFLVVFGPAIKGIDKSLSAKEADRLSSALELELGVLRDGEKDTEAETKDDQYISCFEKAFYWIEESAMTDTNRHPVLIYQYRGDPNDVRADGTLEPLYDSGNQYDPDDPDVAGVDYVIQTSVRRLKDGYHTNKISAELYAGNLVGKVYYVKMRQLVYNSSGEMVMGSLGEVTQLQYPNDSLETDSDANPPVYLRWQDYDDAVLPYRAEFYEVKPPLWSFIGAAAYNPANTLTKPVITKNMAVTR